MSPIPTLDILEVAASTFVPSVACHIIVSIFVNFSGNIIFVLSGTVLIVLYINSLNPLSYFFTIYPSLNFISIKFLNLNYACVTNFIKNFSNINILSSSKYEATSKVLQAIIVD